jgi:hypothetical protein
MVASNYTTVLDGFLDPMVDCFDPQTAQKLINLRSSQATQQRFDELADKHNQGKISASELSEYEAMVHAIGMISVLQAKARLYLLEKTGQE